MSIVYDSAQALLHMHTNGFVHRNLQPCNMFLYKKSGCIFQPVFFQSGKSTQNSIRKAKKEKPFLYEDLKMFEQFVKQILEVVTVDLACSAVDLIITYLIEMIRVARITCEQ